MVMRLKNVQSNTKGTTPKPWMSVICQTAAIHFPSP